MSRNQLFRPFFFFFFFFFFLGLLMTSGHLYRVFWSALSVFFWKHCWDHEIPNGPNGTDFHTNHSSEFDLFARGSERNLWSLTGGFCWAIIQYQVEFTWHLLINTLYFQQSRSILSPKIHWPKVRKLSHYLVRCKPTSPKLGRKEENILCQSFTCVGAAIVGTCKR